MGKLTDARLSMVHRNARAWPWMLFDALSTAALCLDGSTARHDLRHSLSQGLRVLSRSTARNIEADFRMP